MNNHASPSIKKIKIKKGLNVPLLGGLTNKVQIQQGNRVRKIAIVGTDYGPLKPSFKVAVGDKVKTGQLLFVDSKNPQIKYTAPGSGTVVAINRGAKRVFQSLEIELSDGGEITFKKHSIAEIQKLSRENVVSQLLESGEWVALKTRPFAKVPDPDKKPNSIFINLMDSQPLAPDPALVINGQEKELAAGIAILAKLADRNVFVVKSEDLTLPDGLPESIQVAEMSGPHPAGNSGTHIHFLDPVFKEKENWYIHYQDTIAIGKLFLAGKISSERAVAIVGPGVKQPKIVKTRLGASTQDLMNDEILHGDNNRIIAGSVLYGNTAEGAFAFLGRFHNQITVIAEGNHREFFGWMAPGFNKFSVKNIFASKLSAKKLALNTSLNGSPRAMVPTGMYEKVMPLDIQPTFLLRALLSDDMEGAEDLGVLELAEEDLALCTFVSTGKDDFGPILRSMLTKIEKEG